MAQVFGRDSDIRREVGHYVDVAFLKAGVVGFIDVIGCRLALEGSAHGVCGCDDEDTRACGCEETGFGGNGEEVRRGRGKIISRPWLGEELDLLGALLSVAEDFEA